MRKRTGLPRGRPMEREKPLVQVSTALPEDILEKIQVIAGRDRRSLSQVIRFIVEDRLDPLPPKEKGGGEDGIRTHTRRRARSSQRTLGPRATLNIAATG